MRLFLSSLGALCALQVLGVTAQTDALNQCMEACVASTSAQSFAGCVVGDQTPENKACLCGAPGFRDGVRDCSTAATCGALEADVTNYLDTGFCSGQAPAGPDPAATTAAPAPTNTEAVATSAAEPDKAAETTADAPPPSATPTEEPDAGAGTGTDDKTDTDDKTADDSEKPTGTDESDPKETSGKDADASKPEEKKSGLTSGAEIGIGIGVAAGVLSAAGLALFLFLRSRKRRQGGGSSSGGEAMASVLPRGAGAGRSFGSADSGSTLHKHNYDMEVISNRYEDMVPRQVPRVMV